MSSYAFFICGDQRQVSCHRGSEECSRILGWSLRASANAVNEDQGLGFVLWPFPTILALSLISRTMLPLGARPCELLVCVYGGGVWNLTVIFHINLIHITCKTCSCSSLTLPLVIVRRTYRRNFRPHQCLSPSLISLPVFHTPLSSS